MTRRGLVCLAGVLLLAAGRGGAQRPAASLVLPPAAAMPASLAAAIDPVIDAVWDGFDVAAAKGHVDAIGPTWRLPGNASFDAAIDRVRERLAASGFPAAQMRVVEYGAGGTTPSGWEHTVGTLSIVREGQADEVVLSREQHRVALAINSFSTPAGGTVGRLIDVGAGDRDEMFTSRDLKGAVVLGDAALNRLWQRAVVAGGAAGVISTSIAGYITPDLPGAPATPRDTWDILQWGGVPYDAERKAFGFKASPKAAAALRRAIAAAPDGAVQVRATVASTFANRPTRMLVAEIPGAVSPDERVVMAAHVQEPGANDNASGVATLAEFARSLAMGVRAGRIPAPGRTLTFLWLNEISGSREWLRQFPDLAAKTKYMFSMDMTGEDIAKTGGRFLVERWPDPAAVWERPWDPHSEWGSGNVKAETLKGDLINDLHLAICQRVARKSDWVVGTNPYEGGSDHTVFGGAGIPAVLDWHFTDRNYHSNMDTPDKTSATEMRNVGVAVAASAWLMASATPERTLEVARLVAESGAARLALERREGARLAAADADATGAKTARERVIVAAWQKWYGEAVMSAARLVVGPAPAGFEARIRELATRFTATSSTDVGGSGAASTGPALAVSRAAGRVVGQTAPAAAQRGGAAIRVEAVVLAADRIMAAQMFGESSGGVTRAGLAPAIVTALAPDRALLARAITAPDEAVRRVAVRALGRFERPEELARIAPFLRDGSESVRVEAAQAVGQAMHTPAGAGIVVPDVAPAVDLIRGALPGATGPFRAQLLESLGRLRYDRARAQEIESWLWEQGGEADVLVWLAPVIVRDRAHPLGDRTREALRRLAAPAAPDAMPSAFALQALAASMTEADAMLIGRGASYACRNGNRRCGWEVRYAAIDAINPAWLTLTRVLETARRDEAFQVRLLTLRKLAGRIASGGRCAPLVDAFTDVAPIVALEAIQRVDPRCPERDAITARLAELASGLSASGDSWHVPARALESLARFDAARTSAVLTASAIAHPVWQVRAAAARAAATIKDDAALLVLGGDAQPNVVTEAIAGLARLRSAGLGAVAVRALASDDHQLVRAAAGALTPADAATATAPLVAALARLTKGGKDTSRDPRVAILERLRAFATPAAGAPAAAPPSPVAAHRAGIESYLTDFDPDVAARAADVVGAITGARPAPAPRWRAPEQPTEAELRALPSSMRITMADGGVVELTLLKDEAPLTVARFVTLARAGRLSGRTFHRIVPLFVVQGLSPGANEYAGEARYQRDEIGLARHTRGAVGISTRGRHTGDAQIFFDLISVPRLNFDYTVFATVASGMEVVDGMLEGRGTGLFSTETGR